MRAIERNNASVADEVQSLFRLPLRSRGKSCSQTTELGDAGQALAAVGVGAQIVGLFQMVEELIEHTFEGVVRGRVAHGRHECFRRDRSPVRATDAPRPLGQVIELSSVSLVMSVY